MKKNLFFSCTLAVALLAAGCDQNNTTATTDTMASDNTAATEQEVVIDNPNVVTENGGTATATNNGAAIAFEEPVYNFGTVKEGTVVQHTFKFKNTGTAPLIIQNASASCGCTVPEPPKDPIQPGQTGEIKVNFNTTGKMGQQSPSVQVTANTEPSIVQVSMKGTVEGNSIPTAGADGPVRRN